MGTHSKKKSTPEDLFWCSRLLQIEDSIQYLEGPNGIWKGHDRHIGVQALTKPLSVSQQIVKACTSPNSFV